ncbi:siderophore-interacting protein [Streptomyces griseoluteus]
MTTAMAAPFRFLALSAARTRRLGPSPLRVTFTGPEPAGFDSLGRDQSLSLFLPHPGRREPAVPLELGDDWWHRRRELPDDVGAVRPSYTLRALRRDPDEIDIDFALHGTEPGAPVLAGPASRWAAGAAPGDRVLLLGPAVADNRAIRFRAPKDTDLVVIRGDETALPAETAVLESLPASTPRARPAGGAARRRHPGRAHRGGHPHHLAGTARGRPFGRPGPTRGPTAPHTRPHVRLAGEAGQGRQLRRHFVRERGTDRRRVTFVGYWRRGLTEEQLRAGAA